MTDFNREKFDIPVKTFDGKDFTIRAVRLANEKMQPVILWEGFYQNGLFFDLIPGKISIAEFTCLKGFDVWIIDSRGNGCSTGKHFAASMDDFAALDIPAVIEFVAGKTGIKPVYVGHSQGGNTALMCMMGVCKKPDGTVYLSDELAVKRQDSLKALVTLGSYLDFTFSKASSLQQFVKNGIVLNLFKHKLKIISSHRLLMLLKIFNRLPVPVPIKLRQKMIESSFLRVLLFPLTILLNFISLSGAWSFLYHIPNVSKESRKNLFYKTMEATYWGILAQYHNAIFNQRMMSSDGSVNYSENYHKIKTPVSVVTMEFDSLADPVETKLNMFPKLGSQKIFYTEWKGQGHEDFAMNPEYFHQLTDVLKNITEK